MRALLRLYDGQKEPNVRRQTALPLTMATAQYMLSTACTRIRVLVSPNTDASIRGRTVHVGPETRGHNRITPHRIACAPYQLGSPYRLQARCSIPATHSRARVIGATLA
jgi:hypothetical protein